MNGATTTVATHPRIWTAPRPVLPAYTSRAADYDTDTAAYQRYRRRLVEALPLRPGETVLDVGCGSGLCLPMLVAKVGPEGAVIGFDEAPDMIAIAEAKAARNGWSNVTLLTCSAEDVRLDRPADAALFSAVHDVLMSPAALDNIFAQLRPGAWVVAGGGKWAPGWNVPVNALVATLHSPYVRDLAGFDRPWRLLEHYVGGLDVTELALGAGYLAVGRAR
jgi:SAM-dependent methyltransferase